MTSTLRRLPTFTMAAAMALSATVASPQSATDPQLHDHQDLAEAAPAQGGAARMAETPRDVMAQIAVLDARITMLAADMHMFAGELKVETMAALLTALVERQSLIEHEMQRMHDGMMHRMMMERSAPAASPDEELGAMCAPSP